MEITPNGYRTINGSRQVTFFTLTVDDATYKWHANTPRLEGAALQSWLSANTETYLCGIYRTIYLDAEVVPERNETEPEAWARWIGGGCKNRREITTTVDGEPVTAVVEEEISPIPWKDTHPVTDTPVTWI